MNRKIGGRDGKGEDKDDVRGWRREGRGKEEEEKKPRKKEKEGK